MRRLSSAHADLLRLLAEWGNERHEQLYFGFQLATFVAVALLVEQRWPGAALAVVPGAAAVVFLQAQLCEYSPPVLQRLLFGEGGGDEDAEGDAGDEPRSDSQSCSADEARKRDGAEAREWFDNLADRDDRGHQEEEDGVDEFDSNHDAELEEQWLHLDHDGLPIDADGIVPIGDHLLEGFPWQSAQAFMSEQRLANSDNGQDLVEMAEDACEDGDLAGQSDQMSKGRLDLLFRYMASMEGRSQRDAGANPLRQKLQRKLLQRNAAGGGKTKQRVGAGGAGTDATTGGGASTASADALEDPGKIEELLRELGDAEPQRALGNASGSASKKARRKGAAASPKATGIARPSAPSTPKKAPAGGAVALEAADMPVDGTRDADGRNDAEATEVERPSGRRRAARGQTPPSSASPARAGEAAIEAADEIETEWEWQCPMGQPLLPGSARKATACSSCRAPLVHGAPVMRSAASGWAACEDCVLAARERPVEDPLADPAKMTAVELAAWLQRQGADDALRDCMARVLARAAGAAALAAEASAEALTDGAQKPTAENGRRKRRTGR